MSPDVLTVDAVEAAVLPQSGVGPIDGIVTIDPVGLASVLKITGPVTVPSWPEPITADNVVAITLHDEYIRFANNETARGNFLGDVAKAVQAKHLTLCFKNPEEEHLAVRAGAAGAFPRAPSDLVMLTTRTPPRTRSTPICAICAAPSTTTRRWLRTRRGQVVSANAHLVTTLDNTAPASGLPSYIIGPKMPAFRPARTTPS